MFIKNIIKSKSNDKTNHYHKSIQAYIVHNLSAYKRKRIKRTELTAVVLEATRAANNPIFTSRKKALTYAKYMCQGGLVLKVLVPEAAIIGQYDELTLNPSFLSQFQLADWYQVD